jgi:peptidoglycan-N-acetylglucosamine deacetylase
MESDNEEADTASILLRSFWLLVSVIACQKLNKGKGAITPVFPVIKAATSEPQGGKPIKKKKKKIYLTFDDGPNKGTSKVLGIAKSEQVPISFFLIGEHAFASVGQKAVWDSLRIAEAIDLCNHSFTHAHNRYESYYGNPEAVVEDFERCHDSLRLNNRIARTPGRNTWRIDTLVYTDLRRSRAAVDSLQRAGFLMMGWDLEWHYDHKTFTLSNSADALLKQIDSVFESGRTKVPEHLVLLAHDQVYSTSEDSSELHSLLKKLKEKADYELELVSNYPGAKRDTVKSGK